jgi:hypothetical protein
VTPIINQWGPVAVIVAGYLLGIFSRTGAWTTSAIQVTTRIDDLRETMNKRFDDLHDLLKSEVKRLDDRLERLEHPIVRQS